MGLIDLGLVGLFLLAGFRGFREGFVSEAVALAALLLGVWGAIHFSGLTAQFLASQCGLRTDYLPLIAFAITFAGILVAVHLVGALVDKLVGAPLLGVANNLLGVVFGVLKSAFTLSVLIFLLVGFSPRFARFSQRQAEGSLLYGPVQRFAPRLFPGIHFEEVRSILRQQLAPTPSDPAGGVAPLAP